MVPSGVTVDANRDHRMFLGGDWAALLSLPLIAAVLITWSNQYCGQHSSDSLLNAFMSTQYLTLYFWGQGRLGSLFPTLTSWISDISLNLHAQVFLRNLSTTLFPLLPIAILRPKAPFAWVYADCVMVLFLLDSPETIKQFWNFGQPYGPSLALLGGAVLVMERSRNTFLARALIYLASFLLVLAAVWLNSSLVLIAVPLFAVLYLYRRSETDLALAVMTVSAFEVMNGISGEHYENLRTFNFAWANLGRAIDPIGRGVRWSYLAGGAIALLVSALAIARRGSPTSRVLVAKAMLVVAVVIAVAPLIANLAWVESDAGHFAPRYFMPLTQIFLCVSAIVTIEAIWQWLQTPREAGLWFAGANRVAGMTAPGTIILTCAAIASIAAATLPVDFSCVFGDRTKSPDAEVIANTIVNSGARFIVSDDYWFTWPATYEAIVRGHGRQVFAIAPRGDQARPAYEPIIRSERQSSAVCFGIDVEPCLTKLGLQAGIMPVADPGQTIANTVTPHGLILHTVRFLWTDVPPLDPNKMLSPIGTHTLTAVQQVTPAGWLFFGPYIDLAKGSYAIDMVVSCQGDITGSYLDVTSNLGTNEVAKLVLGTPAAPCDGVARRVSIPFEFQAEQSQVEFRAYYGGNGSVTAGLTGLTRVPG